MMEQKGRTLAMGIAVYMIVKPVFNFLVLGGSIMPLALGLAAAIVLWFGIQWSNTALAIVLMLAACAYLPDNLKQIGLNAYLVYTIEGLLDMGAALLLAFHPEIKAHCRNAGK